MAGRQAGRQAVITSRADIQTLIAAKRAELDALEIAERLLWPNGDTPHVNGRAPKAATAKPRQMRLPKAGDPGLEADVLSVLGKARRSLKGKEVCAALAKRPSDQVIAVLRNLAKAGAVVKSGATLSLRYAVPQFADAK